MAADIRYFINSHLLEPLKQYPTVIQDTMLEIIADKLQLLYEYTYQFPEIISPNKSRLDILQAISDQFLFTVREDADLQEQVDILDHILDIYNKRGSIDTIENMWKYYGGTLPKDVEVVIPSYNLFRYSISKLSGTHVFQDNTVNRTGVYEIRLTNNTYPIPDLRDFLIKELVAAGNYFYFTNTLHMGILEGSENSNAYKYLVSREDLLQIQLSALKSHQGFTWSGMNALSNKGQSYWSGKGAIFLELTRLLDIGNVSISTYLPDSLGVSLTTYIIAGDIEISTEDIGGKTLYSTITSTVFLSKPIRYNSMKYINNYLYCTSMDPSLLLEGHLYDSQGEIVPSRYPGYFIVGETLLGEEIM